MNDAQGTTTEQDAGIATIEELLAHALVLEEEMVERYDEIADSMEVHNNMEVAELFRKLAGYGRKHVAEIQERASGMDLPHIPPWDFKWQTADSPEAAALTEAHYLMRPYHALMLAHRAEIAAHDFYAQVSDNSTDNSVKATSGEFAEEEAEHVSLLEEWVKKFPKPEDNWDYDPDPPGTQE